MLDATKKVRRPASGTRVQPKRLLTYPQITQIDADIITKGPGLYLRDLRDLRANWAVVREGAPLQCPGHSIYVVPNAGGIGNDHRQTTTDEMDTLGGSLPAPDRRLHHESGHR